VEDETNLFDFGDAELERGVDPCENLRPSDEVSRVHHADICSHFLISLSISLFLSLSLCLSVQRECLYVLTALRVRKSGNLKIGGAGFLQFKMIVGAGLKPNLLGLVRVKRVKGFSCSKLILSPERRLVIFLFSFSFFQNR
jgi:hypothetical protein